MAEQTNKSYFAATIWPAIIFVLMTCQRAGHNFMIGWAKGESKQFDFLPSTILVVAQLGCVLTALAMTAQFHGFEACVRGFSPSGMKYFVIVGFWYAAGDVFEMEANKYMDPATYTVLSQSKLIITAILMIFLMRKMQTQLQWSILIVTTLAMGQYCVLKGDSIKDGYVGIILALLKVVISCYVAVLNERAMKQQDEVFLVQFVQVKATQMLWAAAYSIVRDYKGITQEGFFGGYDERTWILIFGGFVVKALLTQYIIKILDSLLKNITEVLAVLLVYFATIFFLKGEFVLSQFISVLTVMLAVYSYVLTKKGAKKVEAKPQEDHHYKLLDEKEKNEV